MPAFIDANGDNIFAGEAGDQRLQHAAAGLLATLKDTLLLYIPGFNGYRRLQAGSYAPTRIAWGRNNRSVVVRVPGVRRQGEASGASHVWRRRQSLLRARRRAGRNARRLRRPAMAPPPPVEGNAYNVPLAATCRTIWTMRSRISSGRTSSGACSDPELRRIFAEIKREELKAFDNEITPLERSTYLSAEFVALARLLPVWFGMVRITAQIDGQRFDLGQGCRRLCRATIMARLR
jgi:glutamine synthetase